MFSSIVNDKIVLFDPKIGTPTLGQCGTESNGSEQILLIPQT